MKDYCPQCGNPHTGTSKVCVECGFSHLHTWEEKSDNRDAELSKSRETIARLRELLKVLQWTPRKNSYGEVEVHFCRLCFADRDDGHKPHCPIYQELERKD